VFRSQSALDAGCAELELLRAHGVPVEVWDRARVEREEPALKPGVVGGLYWPNDAHLRPDRYVAALAARARDCGRRDPRTDRSRRLRPLRRAHRVGVRVGRKPGLAGTVLLAAGAWSPPIARDLGLRLPIQPGKGYSITYSRPNADAALPAGAGRTARLRHHLGFRAFVSAAPWNSPATTRR
jgi:D-amino-acid dehydrogenase